MPYVVISTIKTLLYCFALGLFVNVSLSLSGQKWARNFSFALTCLLLPMISAVIATIISGNIALSLGMVGALSIVRFRHPVKTPFELSIYFLLLTLGISASVNKVVAILLAFGAMSAIYLYSIIINRKSLQGFIPNLETITIDDTYLLEITSSSEIKDLMNSSLLLFSHNNLKTNEHTYKLNFKSSSEAKIFIEAIELEHNVITSKKLTKL